MQSSMAVGEKHSVSDRLGGNATRFAPRYQFSFKKRSLPLPSPERQTASTTKAAEFDPAALVVALSPQS